MTRGVGLLVAATPLVAVIAAALLVASPVSGVTTADTLPDLIADPPTHQVLDTYVDATGGRLLLRFSGYVHNAGGGPLELRGASPSGAAMSVVQRVFSDTGASHDDGVRAPEFLYETADGHQHWHLIAAMRYSLYDRARTNLVSPATKTGFCMMDSERVGPHGPSAPMYRLGTFCGQSSPGIATVTMGISPGWRDVYIPALAFQWVDVSAVSPGEYWLAAEADPDDRVIEADETNNGRVFANEISTVPGHVAQPLVVQRSGTDPVSVGLAATSFGLARPPLFRIETAPAHGTLSVEIGVDLPAGASLVYTPLPGYSGSDAFTYSARDPVSSFPRQAGVAAVTIHGPAPPPQVTISGAPSSIAAGTSVQLTAVVTGDTPSVSWSVNGIAGGNADVGTIDSGGGYAAPAEVPTAGEVSVRAASARASAEVSIKITVPPPPVAAPAPTPPAPKEPAAAGPAVRDSQQSGTAQSAALAGPPTTPSRQSTTGADRRPLLSFVLGEKARALLVSVRSRRPGEVTMVARLRGKRVSSCVVKTPAGRTLTCSLALLAGSTPRGLSVTFVLRAGGRIVDMRRLRLVRPTHTDRTGIRYWASS